MGSLRVMFARRREEEGEEEVDGGSTEQEPFGKLIKIKSLIGLHIVREVYLK